MEPKRGLSKTREKQSWSREALAAHTQIENWENNFRDYSELRTTSLKCDEYWQKASCIRVELRTLTNFILPTIRTRCFRLKEPHSSD